MCVCVCACVCVCKCACVLLCPVTSCCLLFRVFVHLDEWVCVGANERVCVFVFANLFLENFVCVNVSESV